MAFRMSSIQFMTNYQSSLNKTYQKQAKLLEQGDGSTLHRGSDDPIAYSKLLRYKVSATENDQYNKNVKTAIAWMETTDSALTHMAEITKNFKEKTIAAATDVNHEADFDAIAKEMWAMIEEIYATSKTQHDGRYVFSGQMDKTEPFTLSTETVERVSTKSLNASQAAFFKGIDDANAGTLYQMIRVQDTDTGVTYLLDLTKQKLYSEDFVETGYKAQIEKGVSSADSVVASDAVISDATVDSLGSDTAISTVADLLNNITDKTNPTNVAKQVTAKLNEVLNSSGYSTNSNSARQLASLYEISTASNSDTQITNILTGAGITTDQAVKNAFNTFFTNNSGALSAYSDTSSLNYYVNNQGITSGDGTIDLKIGNSTKTYKFVTEKQQMIKYHGDGNYISMVKMNGATDTSSDIVNAVGRDLFGNDIFDNGESGYKIASGSSMINNMLAVYNKVKAGDVKWLSSDGVLLADAANATVTSAQVTIGARLQLYNSVDEMLSKQGDNITEEITNVSGTDVAKMATDLMEMTTLYNMALALGGRVLPQSLADYL